ncbi:MAG: hypothetical protein KHX56_11895 [Clostridiales bacterium]|nr:hypothetical protein [Clostridiales bacterium]
MEKELDFTRNYLRILECMNDNIYPCDIRCDHKLDQFEIPPLLIQTFVENSIKHAITPDGGWRIQIVVAPFDDGPEDFAEIIIKDSGPGFDGDTIKRFNSGAFKNSSSGYHIGIQNAIARLKMFYGDHARVIFSNVPSHGACVQIIIPYRQEEPQ